MYLYGMNVAEMRLRLKEMGSFQLEKAVFKYIKNELTGVILSMNRDQLFRDSEDNDGYKLGTYSQDQYKTGKRIGDPFTMVETGEFYRSMKVYTHYRKIIITSDVAHLQEMYLNPSFDSTDFFGINDEHYREFVYNYINPFIKEWYRKKLEIN